MMPYYKQSSGLPPALESLLNMNNSIPSYQVGGMVGPGGMPVRPAMPGMGGAGLAAPGAAQQNIPPEQLMGEVQRFAQQNPQQLAQIRESVQQLIQSGELTPQELNMIIQMAQAAAQNPAMYPQLRMIAIQRGLAAPNEISEEFDTGLVFTLLLLGAAMQSGGMPAQGGMTTAGGAGMGSIRGMPSFKKGGMAPRTNGDDEAVIAQLHEGEYVIPAHVVRAKGTEFFDKMLATYNEKNGESDD